MSKTLILVGIAAALVFFWISRRPSLDAAQAQALVDSGAKFLDVRSAGEFSSGHLTGAVNIPLGELLSRTGELGATGTPWIVYCASGMRSARAKGILEKAGFEQIVDIGSQSGWPLH